MGLKAAHGLEVVGHLFRSIWELGYVITTTDYSNGFNTFERQAMLDAVNKKCSGLNALFSKYYALDAICFFHTDVETKIIWSKQGSRMGCVMGSFGFDLTVDIKFSGGVVKALTDDLIIGIEPPESEENMDNFWEKISTILKFNAEESRKVAGLELNFSKCHCLAPAKVSDPKPETLPKGTNLERNEIRLAGAPIGTDEFCKNYMKKKVNEIKFKMNALDGINPQIGLGLLRIGIVSYLILVSQVTPPELTFESLIEHDKNIISTVFKFLNPVDRATPPKYSNSGKNRSIDILRLPIRHNRVGLTESALIAPIAFYASLAASCTVDLNLNFFQKGLNRCCESTHSIIIEKIGPPSPETIKLETIFPRYDMYALLDSTFYVDIYNNNPSLKLQKELSKIAHDTKAKNLKDACMERTKEIDQGDVVARHTLSRSSILFRTKLSKKNNRMNREDFIA